MKRLMILIVLSASIMLPPVASATTKWQAEPFMRQHQPFMGCAWRAAPDWFTPTYRPCGKCYLDSSVDAINYTVWSHWGTSKANGHGWYDSQRATMQAYGLRTMGCGAGDDGGIPGGFHFKTYTKLTVSLLFVDANGKRHPYHLTFNVTPTIQC